MQVEHHYSVSVRELLAVLTDPTFLTARNERYGGAGAPAVAREGDDVVVTVPRQLPLEHVPAAFHRFVGDGRFAQTDRWTTLGASHGAGSWSVATGRAPIHLAGTHAVTEASTGCLYVVAGAVKVSLPVVGGRLAREVDEHLADLVRHELAFAADWLARG